jgi:hypothetical protein
MFQVNYHSLVWFVELCARVYCTSDFIPIYNFVMMQIIGLLSVMDFMDGTGPLKCVLVRTTFHDSFHPSDKGWLGLL